VKKNMVGSDLEKIVNSEDVASLVSNITNAFVSKYLKSASGLLGL